MRTSGRPRLPTAVSADDRGGALHCTRSRSAGGQRPAAWPLSRRRPDFPRQRGLADVAAANLPRLIHVELLTDGPVGSAAAVDMPRDAARGSGRGRRSQRGDLLGARQGLRCLAPVE